MLLSKCAIPAFEGLLPEPHNNILMDMLFSLATWHGLAKLRQHTTDSLSFMEHFTTEMGGDIRRFKRETCSQYHTRELDKKSFGGKKRRKGAKRKVPDESGEAQAPAAPSSKKKELNLDTVKTHGLAHYPFDVPRHGTTDNYSTQPVSDLFNCLQYH